MTLRLKNRLLEIVFTLDYPFLDQVAFVLNMNPFAPWHCIGLLHREHDTVKPISGQRPDDLKPLRETLGKTEVLGHSLRQ